MSDSSTVISSNERAAPGSYSVCAPRVNVAVSGIFHYRQYIRHLSATGSLNRFYYSHRRATDATSLGLRGSEAVNLWLKEYLTHAHLRLIGGRLTNALFPFYQQLFDRGVVRNWTSCDLLHVMLHGASQATIRRAQAENSIVIGEPVNAHPKLVRTLMDEEYERLGISQASVEGLNNGQKQTIEEAERCDLLLAPSRFVAESYVEAGVDREKVSVIPYGANLQQFSPGVRRDDGVFRVLCVSQISSRKGHIDLLEAWRQLRLPNGRLEFIGSMTDEMRTVLERYAGLFVYRGHVPHCDLVHEYSQADVVVVPSIEDGFSIVPLEAMACGVPVIVSRNAGVSEVINDGETGYVVPARAPNRIAEALESLYRSPELRRFMAEAAVRQVRESLSWELYVERLRALYSQAFARRASSVGMTSERLSHASEGAAESRKL